MNSDWTKVRLNELADITMGQSPSSEHYNLEGIGLPFFQGCSDFGELYPSERKYCSKPTRIAKRGDVLMSVRAPVGDLNIANKECCIGRGVCSIRSKTGDRFVYYLLKVNLRLIQSYSGGTTYQSINKKEVNELPLFVPTLIIQQKIAAIFSSYDNLIENNTRRIQILEEMAQRIYKEWFVDFKYPGHENDELVDSELGMIPEGWSIAKMGDVFKIYNGKGIKPGGKGKYLVYGSNGIIGRSDNYKSSNAIIIGRVGAYCGSIVYCINKFWASDNTIIAEPIPELFSIPYAYHMLQKLNLNRYAGGAAQPLLTQTVIKKIPVVVPKNTVVVFFEEIVNDKIRKIEYLKKVNANLRQTRDLLLPKLISGKVDVSDLDIEIGET